MVLFLYRRASLWSTWRLKLLIDEVLRALRALGCIRFIKLVWSGAFVVTHSWRKHSNLLFLFWFEYFKSWIVDDANQRKHLLILYFYFINPGTYLILFFYILKYTGCFIRRFYLLCFLFVSRVVEPRLQIVFYNFVEIIGQFCLIWRDWLWILIDGSTRIDVLFILMNRSWEPLLIET